MAQRRMMSLKIIDTDQFMDMPLSTQCLYFHLMIRADDDGFIGNQKKILRMVGCNDDDMKILANKGFVIPVVIPNGEGIIVIAHWKVHNFIRSDRYHETIYKDEKALFKAIDGVYQMSYQPDTEVRLELELELGKKKLSPAGRENEPADFKLFYSAYPRKKERGDALKAFKTHRKSLPPIHELVETVEAWKQSDEWTRDGGQFIPYPAKWIRRQGWLDERQETADERRVRLLDAI